MLPELREGQRCQTDFEEGRRTHRNACKLFRNHKMPAHNEACDIKDDKQLGKLYRIRLEESGFQGEKDRRQEENLTKRRKIATGQKTDGGRHR